MVAMPSRNLVVVPDNISFNDAALTEPLAVCWHAVRLGINALDTEIQTANTLVIGGGAIGLGSALSLMAKGVKKLKLQNQMQKEEHFFKQIHGLIFMTLPKGMANYLITILSLMQ